MQHLLNLIIFLCSDYAQQTPQITAVIIKLISMRPCLICFFSRYFWFPPSLSLPPVVSPDYSLLCLTVYCFLLWYLYNVLPFIPSLQVYHYNVCPFGLCPFCFSCVTSREFFTCQILASRYSLLLFFILTTHILNLTNIFTFK